MKNIRPVNYSLLFMLILIPFLNSQSSDSGMAELDNEYLQSLPDSVRKDVEKEMMNKKNSNESNVKKRPSSKISKNLVVQDWERFKLNNKLNNDTERYGVKLFRSMQSSFMPLNEPNFGNNYIVDYGDVISIDKFGAGQNKTYKVEVGRDGSILLPDIGKVNLAGLNFEQVSEVIQKKYKTLFIGVEAVVTLSEIRDINVLVTGNVAYPGIYTLSGNSNVLQALNIVGGVTENGSLRNITIKRNGKADLSVDLYQALMFGDVSNIPFLMSGDAVYIEPVKSLVRAGHGFNNVGIYELKIKETLNDLIKYAGGLMPETEKKSLNLVRLKDSTFVSSVVKVNNINLELNNLDSVYAYKERIGTITISGDVKLPGKYSISSSDRLSDILERSGGYTSSAYAFAGTLTRESSKKLEKVFSDKTYKNLISYIASYPQTLGGAGDGLSILLSELRDFEPSGRFVAEFDQLKLKENIQDDIYLNDGDKIFIPSYSSNVYVFGEVGNPGSVLFKDSKDMKHYINKSGGFTRLSSSDFIFIVSPNGETSKVQINGIKRFIESDYEIYPGSVIYVPRHIGRIQGVAFLESMAPIFSSLALSIASLNSISD